MPTLQELVTKFTSDLTELDKGFDEAQGKGADYAQAQGEAMKQTEGQAAESGEKVKEALSKPYESVQEVIWNFAKSHPYAAVAVVTIGLIAREVMAWQQHKRAVEEATNALWDQSDALAEAAVRAGEYGRAMAKAMAEQGGKSAEGHTAAYAAVVSDEEATRRIADLRRQAVEQREASKQAGLEAGQFSHRWSDKLNPFGAPWKENSEARQKDAKQQLDDINKRIKFYQGIKAMHAQEADESAAAAQKDQAASAKQSAAALAASDKASARAQVLRQKEADRAKREADAQKEREARLAEQQAREQKIAAEAARDSQVQNAANQYFIAAELAADRYDQQRLEIKGRHLETLRQIERAGGDETAVRLAILRSSNALKDVDAKQSKEAQDRRERESELAAKEAKASADAVAKQQAQEAAAAEKTAKAAIDAKRKELERQTKELEDARRDAYSKVGFTSIDEIGRNAVVSGMRAQFVNQQDLLRGSALTGMGAAARENDRLIASNQQQVALLEKLLRAFEVAWRATPQGI